MNGRWTPIVRFCISSKIILFSLLFISGVSMASDFTSGVVVGTILADDSSSQQQEPREPDKTIQFTGDDQNPVVNATENSTEEPSTSINNTYSPAFKSPFRSMSDGLLDLISSPIIQGIAILILVFSIFIAVARNEMSVFIIGFGATILIFTAPTIVETILSTPGGGTVSTPNNDYSGVGFGFIFVLVVPVLIIMGYKFLTSSRDEELDEILDSYRERIRDERELSSVDELRERQERENNSEQPEPQPRVISRQNADAGIEITKNKRKIVID